VLSGKASTYNNKHYSIPKKQKAGKINKTISFFGDFEEHAALSSLRFSMTSAAQW
jgi:hypothetical protein